MTHNISDLAPIILFVYNRPEHTLQTLLSLQSCQLANQSILYIFSDGPKESMDTNSINSIYEVRKIIRSNVWCKEVIIIESETNKGLADSIINGVTEVINKHGKAIILEDDLITSKGFLRYMNNALNHYENEEKVMQISGHCFPSNNIPKNNSSFFIPVTTSWGWGTWKRAWGKFDKEATGYKILKTDRELEKEFNINNTCPFSQMLFDQMDFNKIDSWAIRWWWSVFKEKGYILYPDNSLIKNIGFGKGGTHTKNEDPFSQNKFDYDYFIHEYPTKITINKNNFKEIKISLAKVFGSNTKKRKYTSFVKQAIRRFRHIF